MNRAIQEANQILKRSLSKSILNCNVQNIIDDLYVRHNKNHFYIHVHKITYIHIKDSEYTKNHYEIPIIKGSVIYKGRLLANNIIILYNKTLASMGDIWQNDWLYITAYMDSISLKNKQSSMILNTVKSTFAQQELFKIYNYKLPHQSKIHQYLRIGQPRYEVPLPFIYRLGYVMLRTIPVVKYKADQNGNPIFKRKVSRTKKNQPILRYLQWKTYKK